MKRVCQDCGAELSFRTERFLNGRYLCPKCLEHLSPSATSSINKFAIDNRRLASLGSRFVGQIVDYIIAIMLMYVCIILLVPGTTGSKGILGEWMTAGGIILGLGYYLLADALPGGQSIGKRLAGTKVVDASTGVACNVGQSIGRNLLGFLGIFDWFVIFGEKRQRLGDKAANTVVIWK